MSDTPALPLKTAPLLAAILIFLGCWALAYVTMGFSGLLASGFFAPAVAFGLFHTPRNTPLEAHQPERRSFIIRCLSRFLGQICHPTVAMVVEVDDFSQLEEVYGTQTLANSMAFVQSAIEAHLMEDDVTIHLEGGRFACALAPLASFELEAMLNNCTRIQHSLATAPIVTELPMPLTASVGFAASDRLERPTADALLQSAFSALSEARPNGPNAVRSFLKTMSDRRASSQKIAQEA